MTYKDLISGRLAFSCEIGKKRQQAIHLLLGVLILSYVVQILFAAMAVGRGVSQHIIKSIRQDIRVLFRDKHGGQPIFMHGAVFRVL